MKNRISFCVNACKKSTFRFIGGLQNVLRFLVSAYLLMNLLGGKCIVEKIEKCGLKLVRAFLNIDLLGGINYGEYRYAGLNSYNLQLIGKDKVDKNSFLHWKKNI